MDRVTGNYGTKVGITPMIRSLLMTYGSYVAHQNVLYTQQRKYDMVYITGLFEGNILLNKCQ